MMHGRFVMMMMLQFGSTAHPDRGDMKDADEHCGFDTSISGAGQNCSTRRGAALIQTRQSDFSSGAKASTIVDVASRLLRRRRHADVSKSLAQTATELVQDVQSAHDQSMGSLNDVVGKDGVFMLGLQRSLYRYQYSEEQLSKIGIQPSFVAATDGVCAPSEALSQGCVHESVNPSATCQGAGKAGKGCVSRVEQAIADSHRRAPLEAQLRNQNWTAIFEDDVVPVLKDGLDWNVEFRRAWSRVPPEAKMVRLSWCVSPEEEARLTAKAKKAPISLAQTESDSSQGLFNWMRSPDAGGCTAAYMVHRSIIPELLTVFPCCCAVDCCYANDFFNKPDASGHLRRHTLLFNLDAFGSKGYIEAHAKSDWGTHYGVLMQSKDQLGSTREVHATAQTSC
jgi:hypothetical protein